MFPSGFKGYRTLAMQNQMETKWNMKWKPGLCRGFEFCFVGSLQYRLYRHEVEPPPCNSGIIGMKRTRVEESPI